MAILALTFDNTTGRILAQKVGSDQIGNGAILSAHIGAGAVGTPHLAANAIVSGKIGSGVMLDHPMIAGTGLAESGRTPAVLLRGEDGVLLIRNNLDDDYCPIHANSLWFDEVIGGKALGTTIQTYEISGAYIAFAAEKYDIAIPEVARLQGTANPTDPYFQATLPMRLKPSLTPPALLEGHFWYASGLNVLNYQASGATMTLATTPVLSGSIGSGQVGAIHVFPFTSGQVIIGQGTETPVYGGVPAGTPGDNTITSAKIASGQVGDGHIYDGAIISGKIASGIVGIPHFQPWASGKLLVGQGATTTPITVDRQAGIEFVVDGFGSSIQTGTKGFIEVPFPGMLNSVRLLGDQSGQINVHIWKTTYASHPPTSGNTICSSLPPSISGSFKYENTFLSGWNKSIASGDILGFAVAPNASNIQLCTVSLGVYR